jgi:hypothetical protein
MARPKKRSPRQKHQCDAPLGNITVSESLNSGSVVVNAAKKDSLDSVSCGSDSSPRPPQKSASKRNNVWGFYKGKIFFNATNSRN